MDLESKEEKYTICPVCNKSNPVGVAFCQHCWGAILNQGQSYTTEELTEAQENRTKLRKRKKYIRWGIVGAVAALIVFFVLFNLFSYTDLISKPNPDINSGSLAGEWAMFGYDNVRSSSAGNNEILPEGKLKWMFPAGDEIHSSAAIVDGTVFFGSQDYNLYSLDAETGGKNWEFVTGSRVYSSPAVVDGIVYFGSNDGNFYALDSDKGEKIWEFMTPYPVRSSPTVTDEKVYFGSDDYFLYALDYKTGEEIWRFDTNSPAGNSPVIENGVLYYGAGGGYSYALNAGDGHRRLYYRTRYAVYASPAVYDGIVYFATTNGILTAVDGMARSWLWEHDIRPFWAQLWAMINWLPEPPDQSGFIWAKPLYRPNTTTPLIDGDILYLGSGNFVVALNTDTQQIIWEFATGDTVRSSPAKAGSVIYIGSEDGNLYALDAVTGELQWQFETGGAITASPVVMDGVVYVGSTDGNFYAIE
ncbi:MAG: PQQ-like beta-propeller repeat protein [Dehalococcoidales bacterium]|nr:MAG: PQQ-like beta-propeller repeat protein [Dehalococcoidales bacterium]